MPRAPGSLRGAATAAASAGVTVCRDQRRSTGMPGPRARHLPFTRPNEACNLDYRSPSAAHRSLRRGRRRAHPPADGPDSGAIRVMGLQLQDGRESRGARCSLGPVGLGHAAVQLGDPHLCVHRAVPDQRDFPRPRGRRAADGDPAKERALAALASGFGWAITIAGLPVAVIAPVLGQRADVSGRRKFWLVA